jgi:hypothetical protein
LNLKVLGCQERSFGPDHRLQTLHSCSQ